MSDKNSKDHNSQSDNDEDFGLPPVNITPLEGAKATGSFSRPGKKKSAIPSKNNPPVEEEKKDNTVAVFLFILLLILGLGFGLYYFGLFDTLDQQPSKNTATKEQIEKPAPAIKEEVPEAVVEEPEPAEKTAPQLLEIDARETAPRYFLVVGSFIDDDLARDYSNKLNKAGKNTFLIHPYGKIHYYRLAIGQFENVDLALEARESFQDNFEENLWVLKY